MLYAAVDGVSTFSHPFDNNRTPLEYNILFNIWKAI